MNSVSPPASRFVSPRTHRFIEVAIELPVGLVLIALGVALLRPAMWWLNAKSGFQNSPTDVTTINAEGYNKLAAALIAIVSGLGFVLRAAWLLYACRRRPGG